MNSSTAFDLCSLSNLTGSACHTEEYFDEYEVTDGYRTPPTMTPYVEFPPTLVFKSKPMTFWDAADISLDSGLLLPLADSLDYNHEDMENSIIATKLLPRFQAVYAESSTSSDHLMGLPSLADSVSTNVMTEEELLDCDSSCSSSLSMRIEQAPTMPETTSTTSTQNECDDTAATNADASNILPLLLLPPDKEHLQKRPLSPNHQLNRQIPTTRRKSLGAYAA